MNKQRSFAVHAALLFLVPALPALAVPPLPLPPSQSCSASQLSFSLDDKRRQFDGMPQAGTLLVLRNKSRQACSVPARPVLTFEDAKRQPLPILLRSSPGMHPGPVILPATIPAKAKVSSQMRWVSSDAYDGHNCVSPAFIALSIGEEQLRARFKGQLCGPKDEKPTYSLTLFGADPAKATSAR